MVIMMGIEESGLRANSGISIAYFDLRVKINETDPFKYQLSTSLKSKRVCNLAIGPEDGHKIHKSAHSLIIFKRRSATRLPGLYSGTSPKLCVVILFIAALPLL